jgi:hypothetical protein
VVAVGLVAYGSKATASQDAIGHWLALLLILLSS